MSIPTVEEILDRVADALADPGKRIYTYSVTTGSFKTAWRELYMEMLKAEAKFLNTQITYTVPALTTSLTPAQAGISNFGELTDYLEERTHGTTNTFSQLVEVDDLSQRVQGSGLEEYTWRGDTWYFIGATQDVDLRITYMVSALPPTTGTTGIDDCFNFLWARTAALAAIPRGQVDDARYYDSLARGPKLDNEAGYLADFLSPQIRSLQRTPIQPRAYSADDARRRHIRQWPYIPA